MKKNITTTTATTTNNQKLPQIQRANLTFAQAKKKFVGTTIVRLGDVVTFSMDDEECVYCEEENCVGCPYRQAHYHVVELGIDDVHSTRRSFLLECEALGTSFVVPKEQAAAFRFEAVTVSENVWEQLCNLGINLDESKLMYCRAWTQKTRREKYRERQFVYPCDRCRATCLALVASSTTQRFDYEAKKRLGAAAHEFVFSYCDDEDADCSDAGMECWLFQYDAESDALVLPADENEAQIDRMIELLER